MTKKIAISIPDDVAEKLGAVDNVSAYVTEAVRRRMRGEQIRSELRKVGVDVTEEGVAAWRDRLAKLDAQWTPEERAAAWARVIDHAEDGR